MESRPLSIAIYHNLPSGGAKRALYGFARELAIRGHRLSEIRLSTAEADFLPLTEVVDTEQIVSFHPAGIPRFHIPIFGSYIWTATNMITLRRLASLSRRLAHEIDEKEYDVVFVHDCLISLKPPILQYLDTPTVFYCHHSARGADYAFKFHDRDAISSQRDSSQRIKTAFYSFAQYLYWSYFSYVERMSARSATTVLVNSFFARESFYRDFGINAHVVPYGIDTNIFSPSDVKKGNYVLSVGALSFQKGYRFLVQAISRIPDNLRPTLIILANAQNTEERKIVLELAERSNVQLKILRVMDEQRLRDFYSGAQVFVYTPIMESFGLAPLEAMACGTPVVAVKEGGVRESIRDGETGFLVERDPVAFAETVSYLLSAERLMRQLGQNAVEYVRSEWTWEKSVDRLEKHLKRSIST